MRSRDHQAGFALVQVVCALALSSLVMLLMLSLGGFAAQSSAVSARHVDDVERFATGLSALRRDLTAALRVEIGTERDGSVLLFHGDALQIGLAVGGSSGGQNEMVVISARGDSERGDLVRVSRLLSPDAQGFGGGGWSEPVALLEGPWRFEFSYAAAGFEGLQWLKSWPRQDKLPAVVRLEAIGLRPGQKSIPPLIVPIRIDAGPPCDERQGRRCGAPANELVEAG